MYKFKLRCLGTFNFIPALDGGCPKENGWHRILGRCIYNSYDDGLTEATWEKAKEKCEKMNIDGTAGRTSLASISTQAEQEALGN